MAYHSDGTTCSFAEEYEEDVLALEKELNKLQAENKKLREVLEFYADSENWQSVQVGYGSRSQIKNKDLQDTSSDDRPRLVGGFIAREALKEVGER
jgi:hypothetical protein